MQVKLKTLVDSWPTLQKLGGFKVGEGINIQQAYRLGKLCSEVELEIGRVDKLRSDLFLKYGEQVDGETVIKQENVSTYITEIEYLLSETVELNIPNILLSELDESIPLTPLDFKHLSWLIIG